MDYPALNQQNFALRFGEEFWRGFGEENKPLDLIALRGINMITLQYVLFHGGPL